MSELHFSTASHAEPKACNGKRLHPVNVGWGGVALTLTTKYKDMNADSLGGHRWGFQRTTVLIEYE